MSQPFCANSPENCLNETQSKLFNELAQKWEGSKSIANSATAFAFPESHYDVIRPGLFLYGASLFKGIKASDYGLKPVMTLQTRLISVKKREAVTFIGYGDGYLRALPPKTPVLVNGKRCHLVGRISMDMAAINPTPCNGAAVGDSVVLWGDGLPIEEVIEGSSLIPNELLTGVQSRVKFHWTM